jgi:hypothetical protein
MKLTLIVPGLVWPEPQDTAELARDLPLPALAMLIGRGKLERRPQKFSELTADAFDLASCAPAKLAAEADGLDTAGRHWLLAEPSHLRVDRDRALLADTGILSISQEEADALLASLNQHFEPDGIVFHAPAPNRWYASLATPSKAEFTPLCDVVGEDINRHLPKGEGGLIWSRFLNELQMLLYTHPVNDAREERGVPTINTVWFWGEGEEGTPRSEAQALLADDPLWQRYAASAGMATDDAPFALSGLLDNPGYARHVITLLDAAHAPAQYRDAWGWREALKQLEENWFAPVLAALKGHQVSELKLVCHGEGGFVLTVRPTDLWKFWRRAKALPTLY